MLLYLEEIDSLIIDNVPLLSLKVLNGVCEVPWYITWEAKFIKQLIKNHRVELVYTFEEGKNLDDFVLLNRLSFCKNWEAII